MDSESRDDPPVREYRVSDRAELARLLRQMYQDMHAVYGGTAPALDADWEHRLTTSIEHRLGRDLGIFVIEGERGQLVSLAGGRICEGLPSPRRRHLMEGYIEWVVTDATHRRRGYASAVIKRLLEWFRQAEALSVSLNSSPAAESIYLNLGFSADGPRALSMHMTRTDHRIGANYRDNHPR